MLDNTTKRRIDDCRDILVGKLPDPKAQIEQITIALIYKFMDDMDKEAVELGGEAKFFSGDYAKYSWDVLFSAKVTSAEMLRLYSEAIESMEKNPNIPQLFRDIFNNAYLPYRDPETLRLFLRTIGEFEYTHSEKLGDAFEYLLSVMGSQGDAGQFRTPRHIIDFLVELVDPKKTDTILDPACGTAGFLISAYKHITDQSNNQLTPDDRKKIIQNLVGYDISPDMVRLSLVNLYLHGFSDPHITEYDTLSSEERWDERFDVILANPPFMSPKGGIRPHKKFTIKSNRSEVLFVDYIAEHLNPNGRAGIIVPEGVIFQSGTAYKELRKMLVNDYLYAVVSLPAGIFNPYSGVKTSILLMDKALAKKTDSILFIKIDNDGYNLGAQRTIVKGSQLAEAIATLRTFRASVYEAKPFESTQMVHAISKAKIAENGDFNLSGERYKTTGALSTKFESVKLDEVADIIRGVTFSKKDQLELESDDSIKVATTKAAQESGIIEKDLYHIPASIIKDSSKLLKEGDILMSTANSLNLLGRTTFVQSLNFPLSFGAFMTLIRPKDQIILPLYLLHVLRADNAKEYFISNANTTTNISNLTFEALANFQFPLPPLTIQEEIVAEIVGYQKVIEGAKIVVENYRPLIDIDPEWEDEKLGDISEFKNGLNFSRESSGERIRIFGVSHFQNHLIAPISNLEETQVNEVVSESYLLKKGDILFVRSNGNPDLVGRSVVMPEVNERTTFSGFTIRCRLREGIEPMFIGYLFKSAFHSKLMKSTGQGANIRNLSQGILSDIVIPVPPLEVQRQIIAELDKEQELVNANKQLIQIFERKIKDRIAKIWGEEKPETEASTEIAEPQAELV